MAANAAIFRDAVGIVADDDLGVLAEAPADQAGDAAGVVLIGGDHQPAGVGLLRRGSCVSRSCAWREHARQPLAVEAQRGAQSLGHAVAVELVLEVGALHRAVRRASTP